MDLDNGACDEDFLNPEDPANITCEDQGFELTDCVGYCFNDADCLDNGGMFVRSGAETLPRRWILWV